MDNHQVFVDSEIGTLRKVLVHNPSIGISRVSPKRADEMLFDDIVHLPLMQQEHQLFKSVLECFVGTDGLLEIQTLILEALQSNPDLRDELIDSVIEYEELPPSWKSKLQDYDHKKLTEVLLTGYDVAADFVFFDPLPNFIFTRDIAVAIKDHILITKAAKKARYRENLLTRFIFLAHPSFTYLKRGDKIINLNNLEEFPPSRNGTRVSVEGGDIMMFNKNNLLIGCSERTTQQAYDRLKMKIFEKGLIDTMVQVHIPNDRFCMHIDTLFTRIDHDHIICYKPIVYDGLSSRVEVTGKDGSQRFYHSLKDFLLEEVNPNFKFIFSGGGRPPFQEREQWTDGCNLVAMQPGIALAYDRNMITANTLRDYGYQIVKAQDFVAEYGQADKKIPSTKMIITLPSSELSRARGGSHCMTCPITRTTYQQ